MPSEMKVDRSSMKEVTFASTEEYKDSPFDGQDSLEHWAKAGRPLIWIKVCDLEDVHGSKDTVQGFLDVGYGRMRLIVNGEVAEAGNNAGVLTNGDYVMLSSYYGEEYEGGVFKRTGEKRAPIHD